VVHSTTSFPPIARSISSSLCSTLFDFPPFSPSGTDPPPPAPDLSIFLVSFEVSGYLHEFRLVIYLIPCASPFPFHLAMHPSPLPQSSLTCVVTIFHITVCFTVIFFFTSGSLAPAPTFSDKGTTYWGPRVLRPFPSGPSWQPFTTCLT